MIDVGIIVDAVVVAVRMSVGTLENGRKKRFSPTISSSQPVASSYTCERFTIHL